LAERTHSRAAAPFPPLPDTTFKSRSAPSPAAGWIDPMALPLQALEKALNTKVELTLKDRRRVSGTLVGFDEHMNLVLEDAEEHTGTGAPKLGILVLRGSSIVSIHPQ